ncbi:hypothetical protein A3Q29_21580 [Providencia stuartii]|uniref:RHS protein conserved region domain-containing protein n=1 Tax=Providencia stuartii TaxID=588 RepID=A0A1S1HL45_PROST|nr:hypothetical protein A3Q29_21580 [Providencia stuartii]
MKAPPLRCQSNVSPHGTIAYDAGIQWVYQPGAITPAARYQRGKLHYVVTDHQGTPREMFTENGVASWAGRLNTWGQLAFWESREGRAENDPNYIDCHFRFAGQFEDNETGLYYNRFRYYDKDSGQYISPDPIGLLGGFNPYGYVHNPVGFIDPFGLACCPPIPKGALDWGGIDPKGLSRKDHVRRHGIDDPTRNIPHGVFNDNAINQTANAWQRAKELGIRPQVQGNKWIYEIPSPNAGWQGGNPSLPGHGQALNTIKIATDANSNRVVTAFPI